MENSSATAFAVLLIALLLSALATNLIGIFAVFGAFALGAALSDQEDLRRAVSAKLHDIVTGFFVPVFFTYTGLRTDITGIHGPALWLICAAVVAAAVTGKLVGCGLAARIERLFVEGIGDRGRDDERPRSHGTHRHQRGVRARRRAAGACSPYSS